MSELAATKWWSTRRLPSGEVELKIKRAAGRDFRWRAGFVAFGAFAFGALTFMSEEPAGKVIWVATWLLGAAMTWYSQVKGGSQVWRLKPGLAARLGRKETAFFVSEVRLEFGTDSDGEPTITLSLVTPGKDVEIGPPQQPEEGLRTMGQAMAEALGVGLLEIRR